MFYEYGIRVEGPCAALRPSPLKRYEYTVQSQGGAGVAGLYYGEYEYVVLGIS